MVHQAYFIFVTYLRDTGNVFSRNCLFCQRDERCQSSKDHCNFSGIMSRCFIIRIDLGPSHQLTLVTTMLPTSVLLEMCQLNGGKIYCSWLMEHENTQVRGKMKELENVMRGKNEMFCLRTIGNTTGKCGKRTHVKRKLIILY